MTKQTATIVLLGVLAYAGCRDNQTETTGGNGGTETAALEQIISDTPVAGARDVRHVQADASKGDVVVVRGYIGGRKKPLSERLAVATLIDVNVPLVCGVGASAHCPTPWDYCCETRTNLLAATASVQVLGPNDRPIQATLAGTAGIQPFSQVVVRGVVRDVEAGSRLVIDAEKIHVVSPEPPRDNPDRHNHRH